MTPKEREFVSSLCAARAGLKVNSDKGYLLENRLSPVARREGFSSVSELIGVVRDRGDDRLGWALVEAMSPSEATFFRDPEVIDWIVAEAGPTLAKDNPERPLRIWVAACGAGQEVYSLAMRLREQGDLGVPVELYASDLSERRLERARAGIYTQFEVQRGLPVRRLVDGFVGLEEGFALLPQIRESVRWRRVNVMEDLRPLGPFDIILCRNILTGLVDEARKVAADNLIAALRPGGHLVVGRSERVEGLKAFAEQAGAFVKADAVEIAA